MGKKICLVNGWVNGSTGRLNRLLACSGEKMGYSFCFVSRERPPRDFRYPYISVNSTRFGHYLSRIPSLFLGGDGFGNKLSTHKILCFLAKEKPDLIHLGNLHSSFIGLPAILAFAKKEDIPVVWTAHDMWLASGRCCSFDACQCQKWRFGCGECPYKNNYPREILFDSSRKYWLLRRTILQTYSPSLVCISEWQKHALQSCGYSCSMQVIPNGIDSEIFSPKTPLSLISNYSKGRPVVGFCSYYWNNSKGISFLLPICERLTELGFSCVALGFDKEEETKCLLYLPRTSSEEYLADFYSSIDVFVNLTNADAFSMVNLEALSCGTPVVSFDVGGACEMIREGINGLKIPKGDSSSMIEGVKRILQKRWSRSFIRGTVIAEYNQANYCKRYFSLYSSLLSSKLN